jgi:hypothetical protein
LKVLIIYISVMNWSIWAKQNPPTEAQMVSRVEHVWGIILNRTDITTKSGETTSSSTQVMRSFTTLKFSS